MHDKASFHLIPLFSTTVKFNAVSIALWNGSYEMVVKI